MRPWYGGLRVLGDGTGLPVELTRFLHTAQTCGYPRVRVQYKGLDDTLPKPALDGPTKPFLITN